MAMNRQIETPPPPDDGGPVNVGGIFLTNAARLGDLPAVAEPRRGQPWRHTAWRELTAEILTVGVWLADQGVRPGDRVAIVTGNSKPRLVTEMAVMALGAVSVPVFPGYGREMLTRLIDFVQPKVLVAEDQAVLERIAARERPALTLLLHGAAANETCRTYAGIWDLPPPGADRILEIERAIGDVAPETLALIMFTSGTSGFPKGVMLTHRNILSQQAALRAVWRPEPGLRLLSYLPWHHSFGGLFERFFGLASGGCLALDDSQGKDVGRMLENFAAVRPHVFFSVPKIYQELAARALTSAAADQALFHPDLRFVFTAAAPLPLSTSDQFKRRGIPVIEGWGLTETSPCCTLTPPDLDREPGLVGWPIPGVSLRLDDDHDEIQVKGPNVMTGYDRNPEATAAAFTRDGWFRTGDIGVFTRSGLRIAGRIDRVFKLANGEKVYPSALEEAIRSRCRFIKYAYVFGSGQTGPMALLFPNRELYGAKASGAAAGDRHRCEWPQGDCALAACLGACVRLLNEGWDTRYERLVRAALVDRELSLEAGELTPSFKLVPRAVERHYATYIRSLVDNRPEDLPADARYVDPGMINPGCAASLPPGRLVP